MDKFLCILAELDEETQAALKIYEEIIIENGLVDKQTKGIPYHITVNTYSAEHEEYLKKYLDKIQESHRQNVRGCSR